MIHPALSTADSAIKIPLKQTDVEQCIEPLTNYDIKSYPFDLEKLNRFWISLSRFKEGDIPIINEKKFQIEIQPINEKAKSVFQIAYLFNSKKKERQLSNNLFNPNMIIAAANMTLFYRREATEKLSENPKIVKEIKIIENNFLEAIEKINILSMTYEFKKEYICSQALSQIYHLIQHWIRIEPLKTNPGLWQNYDIENFLEQSKNTWPDGVLPCYNSKQKIIEPRKENQSYVDLNNSTKMNDSACLEAAYTVFNLICDLKRLAEDQKNGLEYKEIVEKFLSYRSIWLEQVKKIASIYEDFAKSNLNSLIITNETSTIIQDASNQNTTFEELNQEIVNFAERWHTLANKIDHLSNRIIPVKISDKEIEKIKQRLKKTYLLSILAKEKISSQKKECKFSESNSIFKIKSERLEKDKEENFLRNNILTRRHSFYDFQEDKKKRATHATSENEVIEINKPMVRHNSVSTTTPSQNTKVENIKICHKEITPEDLKNKLSQIKEKRQSKEIVKENSANASDEEYWNQIDKTRRLSVQSEISEYQKKMEEIKQKNIKEKEAKEAERIKRKLQIPEKKITTFINQEPKPVQLKELSQEAKPAQSSELISSDSGNECSWD